MNDLAIKVATTGRTDTTDYFRMCLGCFGPWKLCPLLVFRQLESDIAVEVVTKLEQLLVLSDDTQVMGIWPGQYRSDYFQFTVGDYRQFYEKR